MSSGGAPVRMTALLRAACVLATACGDKPAEADADKLAWRSVVRMHKVLSSSSLFFLFSLSLTLSVSLPPPPSFALLLLFFFLQCVSTNAKKVKHECSAKCPCQLSLHQWFAGTELFLEAPKIEPPVGRPDDIQ